jgi:hypothetical protein
LGSATAAAASAAAAAISESNAATSESNAATSESNAATSEANAAASYDDFDDRYLGAKASAPALDNDGDALIVGALYFDTTDSTMKVYSASGWVAAGSAVNGTANRYEYTVGTASGSYAGSSLNTFPATYDSGFVDVYLNGVKLVPTTDFTATTGTTIVLASDAVSGDLISIIGYGTFELANFSIGDANDVDLSGGLSDNDILQYDSGTGDFLPTTAPTFDGLTVDGDSTIQGTVAHLFLKETDTTDVDTRIRQAGGDLFISTVADDNSLVGHRISLDHATGDISFYEDTGTTAKLFWDASAEALGIGTSSPNLITTSSDSHVDIRGGSFGFLQVGTSTTKTTADVGYLEFMNGNNIRLATVVGGADGANNNGYMRFSTANGGAFAERMRIDSSGNLLVGQSSTTTPVSGNVVGTALQAGGRLELTCDNSTPIRLNRKTSDGDIAQFRKDGTTVGSIGALGGDLYLHSPSGSDSGVRLKSNGINPCGSGGSNRDAAIDLGASSARFKDLYLSGYARLTNASTGTTATDGSFIGVEGGTTALRIVQNENDAMTFHTSGLANERMRIDSSGNLLVGRTSTINGGVNTSGGAQIGSNGLIQAAVSGDTAIALQRLTSDGDIIQFRRQTTSVGSISVTSSGTTYNTTSDARLKTDIQPIADATDRLMQMNPVSHKWKADPEADAVVGFIAQEMQDIVPEAVAGDPDSDEMMSMDYGRITPVLVAALQDAHKKIEELESRLAAVEAK